MAWSPDGSQIAFTPDGAISVVDVESARVRRLTRCELPRCVDFGPAWSPDQTAIAFTRTVSRRTAKTYALYRVSTSGSGLAQLQPEGSNSAWSPDGTTILVDTRYEGIVRVSARGSSGRVLTPQLGTSRVGLPSWSPDGSRISYFVARLEKRHSHIEVWTMEPNGTEKKRIYRTSCCARFWLWFKPVWSADGSSVAFSVIRYRRHRANTGGTFVVDADGTRLRNLTRWAAELAWEPSREGSHVLPSRRIPRR